MRTMRAILRHPEDAYPLFKLKMALLAADKQIPPHTHWAFSYSMLHKVSRSFALVIQQLGPGLRDAICIFYLALRALDTVEDDTSIATDVKVPILKAFHQHIFDKHWHFSCGTKHYKVLMDQFHLVSTAFLELGESYQEAIEDITKRMGAGMAKFICKEVETTEDYDEYCHYVAGLVRLGLSKLFHASKLEDMASDELSNSMGLFLQKTNIIRDYLEDINEIPKSRMFWPRQICGKYADKLEKLLLLNKIRTSIGIYDRLFTLIKVLPFSPFPSGYNSSTCGAEFQIQRELRKGSMVTDALYYVEDCLTYMSALKDSAIFRFCAIPRIMAIGTLAMCYNNIEVFRGVVKMRRGLTARIIDRTKSMSDVYEAFFDFSCMLRSKVDKTDPNAAVTLSRLDTIQKTCKDSGFLNKRKSYIVTSGPNYVPILVMILFLILALIFSRLSYNRSTTQD